jgi:hypothetical protein
MKAFFSICTLFFLVSISLSQTTEWYYTYDPGTSSEEGRDIVLGDDGNLYIAGTTDGSTLNYDIVIISLTREGVERWRYVYDGPVESSHDGANTLCYGHDNRIYIAGYNQDSLGADKFFVLCLDTAGSYVWEYQFADTMGRFGQALDVVAGDDGNVYACGRVDYDFFVASINASGEQNWTYRLNGSCGYALCDDGAAALVYGDDGNIYITGYYYHPEPEGKDAVVVSLAGTGQENWKYFLNSIDDGSDDGRDIVYGTDGNLYVTGVEGNQGFSEHDILVFSLFPSGSLRWSYEYDGPGPKPYWSEVSYEMLRGSDGNLYVAARDGGVTSDLDFCLLSLTDGGSFRWASRYAGIYGDYDMPFSLTQTPDGNVHLAGYFCGLIGEIGMYSVHGTTGRGLWAYRCIGKSQSMDKATAITSDSSGFVYLTGYDNINNNNNRLFVVKLNPPRNSDGWYSYQRLLRINYDSYQSESDGLSFEKTSDGNFIVTGYMGRTGSSASRDLFLMKVGIACDTLWTTLIGGSAEEKGYSVIQTADGGFAVTGYTGSYGAGGKDLFVVKTDSAGQVQFQKWYGGTADDEGNAIVQTGDGGYMIAGKTGSFGAGLGDIWLVRTDANGDTLWTRLLGGAKPDVAGRMIRTSDGNFVFTGSYGIPDGPGYVPLWYMVKFTIDGDTLWTRRYNFGDASGRGYDLVEVENDNIVAVGYLYSNPATLMKVNGSGDTLWTRGYPVNTPYGLLAIDKTIDGGFIALPGEDPGMFGAIVALKLANDGSIVSRDTIGRNITYTGSCQSEASDILSIGASDYLTLGSGKIDNTNFWNVLIARKGGLLPFLTDIGGDEAIARLPAGHALAQNFPNPFNPTTTIRYSVPRGGRVNLVVYDLLGREVCTLVDRIHPAGSYEIPFDAGALASGVYFYRLHTGESVEIRKMVFLK